MKINFRQYNGQNVKIAVIDSGIDISHPDICAVAGGIGIEMNPEGLISFTDTYSDIIGHGTACAAIIHRKACAAELYSIRVLNEDLNASSKVLVKALEWAIDSEIDVVNLSLGTYDETYRQELKDISDYAISKGTIIIAAKDNNGKVSYPSEFQNIIRVDSATCIDKYEYYHCYSPMLTFFANGSPQKIAWVEPRYLIRGGTSFACAHITGIIALILDKYPEANYQEVLDILVANSSNEKRSILGCSRQSTIFYSCNTIEPASKSLRKYPWMIKAALYPYNKWMKTLVRYREILKFEIVGIGDPPHMGQIGKDAGLLIGEKPANILLSDNFEDAAKDADTLVLGYPDTIIRTSDPEILCQMLSIALSMGKNIFVSDKAVEFVCPNISQIGKKQGLKIGYPEIEPIKNTYTSITEINYLDIPVLGVFGMGSEYGTFLVELAVREMLMFEGFKVAQIGWNSYHLLFDIDILASLRNAIFLPLGPIFQIKSINEKMHIVCDRENPDIFIVSTPNGLVNQNPPDATNGYGISSMILMHSTRPDAYILSVSEWDSLHDIEKHIQSLEILSKTKVIFVAINDVELGSKKTKDIQQSLSKKLGIPTSEIISEHGRRLMLDTVISFFTN